MKIPLAERQQTISGESGNVNISTEAPSNMVAAGRFANAAEDAAFMMVEAHERMQQKRDKIEFANKVIAYDKKVGEVHTAVQQKLKAGGGDIFTVTEEANKLLETHGEELQKDISPRIAADVQTKYSEMRTNAVNTFSIHQANAEYDYNEKTKESIVLEFGKSAALYSDSPAKVMQSRDEMLSTLKYTFPNGEIPEMVKINAEAHLASVAIQSAIAEENVGSAKTLLANFAGPLKAKGIYDELVARMKSAEVTNNENALYGEALAAGKRGNVTDWGAVKSHLFKTENREKYNMKPLQVAQLSRVLDEQRQAEQEGVYNNITAKAIQNPNGAMRDIEILMKNPRGYDAVPFRQLYESIKRGQQTDVQFNDQAKAAITTNIMAGVYKDKNELTNAIFSAGLTRGNDTFLKSSMELYDKQAVKYGQQNNFKAGEEAIDAAISGLTTRNKGRKKELVQKKNNVLNAASAYMKKNRISVDDPQATKIIGDMWEMETKTFIQKIIDSINPWRTPPEPMVPEPTPGRPQSRGAVGRRVIKTKTYPDGRIKRLWSDGAEDWK